MGVYTKTGDKGQTSLYTGERVNKDSLRVETYGIVDEMNSALGMARAFCENEEVKTLLYMLQKDVSLFMADLASLGQPPQITEMNISEMEDEMDRIEGIVGPLRKFLVPGDTKGAHHGASGGAANAAPRSRRGRPRGGSALHQPLIGLLLHAHAFGRTSAGMKEKGS